MYLTDSCHTSLRYVSHYADCWTMISHDTGCPNLMLQFEEFKRLVTAAFVLSYYDVYKPVVLQTDASLKGLSFCLLQESQPVCYTSQAQTPTEQSYAQIEKKRLFIVFACQ